MLILKIKQKGLYVEIPGTLPSRTPVEIDITKCNISIVDAYLRKNGITNYQIMSSANEIKVDPQPPKIEDSSIDQRLINKRFTNLEKMMLKLLEKQQANPTQNSEQITDKLEKLEALTNKILRKNKENSIKDPRTIIKRTNDEPEIQELDDTFIPSINTSKMKIKSASKKAIKQNKHDIDDSADLLSRIMGQDD
jgi:hypothetical protein